MLSQEYSIKVFSKKQIIIHRKEKERERGRERERERERYRRMERHGYLMNIKGKLDENCLSIDF